MLGQIMPAPLAMVVSLMVPLETRTSLDVNLGKVSVVIKARVKPSASREPMLFIRAGTAFSHRSIFS